MAALSFSRPRRRALLHACRSRQDTAPGRYSPHRTRTQGGGKVPLKLRPPRKGRTPNYEIRGTYLGVSVECCSGTHKRSIALQQIKRIEAIIEEHRQYPAPETKPHKEEPTFLSAAIAYMRDGGER